MAISEVGEQEDMLESGEVVVLADADVVASAEDKPIIRSTISQSADISGWLQIQHGYNSLKPLLKSHVPVNEHKLPSPLEGFVIKYRRIIFRLGVIALGRPIRSACGMTM